MVLSIIIPCYNEASRGIRDKTLENRLEVLNNSLKELEDYEVIFVSDGSTDGTEDVISSYINENCLSNWISGGYVTNVGKGYAIKWGISLARGDYILFMDADLSSPLDSIAELVKSMSKDICIIFSRYLTDSVIKEKRSFVRKCLSKLSRLITLPFVPLSIRDTQCGFKLFNRELVLPALNYMVCDKWLFDIELLSYLIKCGVKVKEIPITWNNMENESTLKSSSAMFSSFKELVLLCFKHRKLCNIAKISHI